MIKQHSKRCFTLIKTVHPSSLVCGFLHIPVPSGSKPPRFFPSQGFASNLPKACLTFSSQPKQRQMSSLPPTIPPVIHNAEKQEFTITFPGHQSAYLRYTFNNSKRWVSKAILNVRFLNPSFTILKHPKSPAWQCTQLWFPILWEAEAWQSSWPTRRSTLQSRRRCWLFVDKNNVE